MLLNGIPGATFKCKRGVRQGYLLSSLLLVLVADVLQSLVNISLQNEFLHRPLNLQCLTDFPIIQYADDTLIIMQADAQQLHNLTNVLHEFGAASGSKVNYSKSILILINIPHERVHQFTSALQCQEGEIPFTYLGLPLCTVKLKKESFMPLKQCVQRILPSCTMHLNYGSKFRMLNSVLYSLPMFYLSSVKLYHWVLVEIDKNRRHFLWGDKDLEKRNPSLATWDLVCKPKEQGGVGVINLSVQNDSLLVKHLQKFYNHIDIPWVHLTYELYYSSGLPPARPREISFRWRDCLKVLPTFKELATCDFVQGNYILLWKDKWAAEPMQEAWPHLFSFGKNESITLKAAMGMSDLADLFTSLFLKKLWCSNIFFKP
jgi:hypothetical protein